MALERFDFLSAIVRGRQRCPQLACGHRGARRLVSLAVANRGGEHSSQECRCSDERLTYETITQNEGDKPWLTFVASREAGLRQVAGADIKPVDVSDYNLSHMFGLRPNT